MWRLKSPIDEKRSVDENEFVTEVAELDGNIDRIKSIYERLTYMCNKDVVLLLIAKKLEINYPDEVFTLNKNRILYYDFSFKEMKYILYLLHYADKVDYIIPYPIDENGKRKYSEEYLDWEHFIPDFSINDFYKYNLAKLKKKDKEKIQEEYLILAEKVYEDQKKLANDIFFTIDEKDKEGITDVHRYFYSLFNYEEEHSYSLLKESKIYKKVLTIYPLLEKDMHTLLSDSIINKKGPYITIDPNLTCKWNYSIGTFADYFSFITENNNTNWDILKELFPQFKGKELHKQTKGDNQDFLDLMAKVPSFISKSEKNEIKEKFKENITEIKKRSKEFEEEYSYLSFIKDKS